MGSAARDTFALLRYYTLKHKSPVIDFSAFLTFVERYIARYRQERPSLEELAGDTEVTLMEQLDTLAQAGACVTEYEDGKLRKVTFPQYYLDLVHDAWKALDDNSDIPFPSRDVLGKMLPEEMVVSLEVQTQFMQLLEQPDRFRYKVIRLTFPDQLREIVISMDLVQKRLIEYCIAKVRQYLNTQRNADYVRHKLLAVFHKRDLILKDTLDAVIQRPAVASANFINPSEFSFSFWAHMTNFIIQEYKQKEIKLTEEHGFCQAAHILSFYNTFFKGREQKEREEDNALKMLVTGLRQPPYVYSMTDIMGMKDKNGLRIARRTTSERIHTFIESRMVPEKDRAIPEIIRRKGADNALFFIHRDALFSYIIRKLHDSAEVLRDRYEREWTEYLKQYQRVDVMMDDQAFLHDLENRFRIEQPFLTSLLDFDLLSIARREIQASQELMFYVNSMFSESRVGLKPLNEILGLRRKEMLESAKLHLSFWELMPSLQKIMTFLKRMFTFRRTNRSSKAAAGEPLKTAAGMRAGPASGGYAAAAPELRTTRKTAAEDGAPEGKSPQQSSRAQNEAYNVAVHKLKLKYLAKDANIDRTLEELAEKWNPLYDEAAKKNLVLDTNSMIRDYFRSLKRGFRVKPPDAARIENLAATLAENQAFSRIRRKDLFLEYIRIYLVKLLGEK